MFAFLSLLASPAAAGPYSDLARALELAKNPEASQKAIEHARASLGPNEALDDALDAAISETDPRLKRDAIRDAVDEVHLEAVKEAATAPDSVTQDAKRIKSAAVFRDAGVKGSTNWLGQALERLKNLKIKWPEPKVANPNMSGLGKVAIYIVWGILALVVLVLLYFAARHIRWRSSLTRKARALLDDDEPDRSLDEWLVLADSHASAGRYREAVRALYLACLLRYDLELVARFERGQTNWEHLARIQASSKCPPAPDFRVTTQAFDRIWYGHQGKGLSDVDLFRGWYRQLTEAFMKEAA